MIFECGRDDMAAAVANTQRAVNAKSTVTLLGGIHMRAEDGAVVLYGTDNEIGIECTVRARVDRPGEAVVNAGLLGDIVRNLPGETVGVEAVDDSKVRISSGAAVYIIYSIQGDAFPSFPEVEKTSMYAIDRLTLKQMLAQTSFAIGTDETRKVLTGLFLESGNGELRAVAVDGFRVALRKQPVEPAENEIKLIIPSRTIGELMKIIPSSIGELRLYGGDNQAVVEFDNCRMYTGVINGEFFNYRYILPTEYMTQIIIDRKKLLEAVERASVIITAELARRYPVMFIVENDAILIHALSDRGNADEEIGVQMAGEPIELAFNPRYVIETLRAIDDESVVIRFTTKVGQCVIKPINNDSYTYLILPVKTGY